MRLQQQGLSHGMSISGSNLVSEVNLNYAALHLSKIIEVDATGRHHAYPGMGADPTAYPSPRPPLPGYSNLPKPVYLLLQQAASSLHLARSVHLGCLLQEGLYMATRDVRVAVIAVVRVYRVY